LEGRLELSIRPPQNLQDADRWRVVLHFCELDESATPRIFDVKLQGETVLKGLNVSQTAGGVRKAVAKEFTLDKSNTVTLELMRSVSNGPPPIISGLEITAEMHPRKPPPPR
jgi:hypothetical protein